MVDGSLGAFTADYNVEIMKQLDREIDTVF